MKKNYAIILFITENNCTQEEVNKVISTLDRDFKFENRGASYSSDKHHKGTLLIKTSNGYDANTVFEGTKKQLEKVKFSSKKRFNCQLTIAGFDVVTDTIFIG